MMLTLGPPHWLYDAILDHEDDRCYDNSCQSGFWYVVEVRCEKLKRYQHHYPRVNTTHGGFSSWSIVHGASAKSSGNRYRWYKGRHDVAGAEGKHFLRSIDGLSIGYDKAVILSLTSPFFTWESRGDGILLTKDLRESYALQESDQRYDEAPGSESWHHVDEMVRLVTVRGREWW